MPRAPEVKSSLEEALVGCFWRWRFIRGGRGGAGATVSERRGVGGGGYRGQDGRSWRRVRNEADGLTKAQLGRAIACARYRAGRLVESLSDARGGDFAVDVFFEGDAREAVARAPSGRRAERIE